MKRLVRLMLTAVSGFLAACGAPAPAPMPAPTPPPAPIVVTPPQIVTPAPPPASVGPMAKLAPLDPALENWKRSAAEKIHATNQAQLFQGKPHHLLRAVIVVEVTVDPDGKVVRSRVLRSPNIKALDDMALASLKKAAPLPPPPKSLTRRGNLIYSETWLVQNDGKFQVRTLALPQD